MAATTAATVVDPWFVDPRTTAETDRRVFRPSHIRPRAKRRIQTRRSGGRGAVCPGGDQEMKRPSLPSAGLLAAAVLSLALGGAPLLVTGADHLDAPALGGLSANGMFAPHSDHGDRDINDVYV